MWADTLQLTWCWGPPVLRFCSLVLSLSGFSSQPLLGHSNRRQWRTSLPKNRTHENQPEAEVASCWDVMMEASDSAWLGAHQPLCSQCLSRSATFSLATGECRISDMDWHTVAGTSAFTVTFKTTSCNSSGSWNQRVGIGKLATAQESLGDEYLENNCVDDPVKLCDFQLLENRIMKTIHSV